MLFPQSLIRILRSKIYDYLGVITRDIEKGNAEALGKRTGEWLDAGLSLLAIGWTAVKQMKKARQSENHTTAIQTGPENRCAALV